MDTSRTKKALSLAAIVALLIVLVALAFVPMFGSDPPAAARSAELDARAMTALNNCAAYVDGHDFSCRVSGKIKARIFGIPFSQNVSGARSVKNGEYTELVESSSAFVSAGQKKSVVGGAYYVADGKKSKGGFDYGEPRKLDRAEFAENYGKPFTGLTRYALSGAVTSATAIDDNTFAFTLDPTRATEYVKRAVRSALDAKAYPAYRSVEITLVTDGERPVSVGAVERFDIDKFGGTSCVAEYKEEFIFD